ncbi:Pro-Hyp dipeptidase [Glaciihabitans tibetensis]|uniref:Pro-Hyp dipeptidase n=1 Tax=Glaciihabitans tibetensis TaxID=1266600 RepID=A0A2T0VFI4_9MICO|nr:amidohydrolase family protein [Glaciihabitans tibetensis]PRY68814.1 Pro-Hyp dipeptidase [Glaciihabitans tibetensis]
MNDSTTGTHPVSAQDSLTAGVSVWDGQRSLGTNRVRWSGDKIVAIEPADDEMPEYSLIPGLIDTHVHLDSYAGTASVNGTVWQLTTPPEERTLHIAANALANARAGVTTMRDLAADQLQLAVSRAFDAGVLVGPRLLAHGQVGMTAGHGDLFIPPHYPHRRPVADSPDECRRLVRSWAREGATGVKIYTSGGVLSMGDKVGWRNQTLAEIRATVDEAHALGLLVAAHTHTTEGIDIALGEGVDSIEHGTGLNDSHWATLTERNTPVAPTLMINDIIADARVSVTAEAQAKAQEVVLERNRHFPAAGRAGVRFVLGTDASGIFVGFGDQLEEVRLMKDMFGWTAERAMVSATSDAAAAVGLGATVGRIAPGLGSDFVLMKGRPWEDIASLRTENVVAVVCRGRVIAGELPRR